MDIKTILNIMSHGNITSDELLLIGITLAARDEEGHPEYFSQGYENGGKAQLKNLFESLKEKGIIHKDYNPQGYNPNDIEFNKVFLKGWGKYSNTLGQEFLETYPSFIQINGRMCPLKDITKSKCTSLEEFCFFYASQIGNNLQKHKEVIELVKGGKDNDYPFGNIAAFVASNMGTSIKEMRNNPDINNQVINVTRDV